MSYLTRTLPMQRSSTKLLWVYNDFKETKTDDLVLVNELIDTQEELINLFVELEKRMPEMSDEILNRIFERI
jgi:hypothetical protein